MIDNFLENGTNVLGNDANATEFLSSSSRNVIKNRSNDEKYFENNLTTSLIDDTFELGSIIVDNFFSEMSNVNINVDENVLLQNSLN